MPDGNVTVILQGKKRFEIDEVELQKRLILRATIKEVDLKNVLIKMTLNLAAIIRFC